jgi:N-acetylneuraminate synthase
MAPFIEINGRRIGPDQPVYIVAEMSANHGGDFDRAVGILKAAREAGADAVKLQTYTADTMTIDCEDDHFRIGPGTVWEGKNLHQLYREASTPWDWQPRLKQIARGLGLDLFSTPFDESAVEFLERMDVPAYKIASFELVDLPFLRRVAQTGRPMILSTGMASSEEIDEAARTLREAGNGQLALLKCTSAYPSPPDEMNLRAIPSLAETFRAPVGLSDHTLDLAVPIAAVSLGACIVEKHLTLSRAVPGPDSAFSLEPPEFKAMVEAVRITERALGAARYEIGREEAKSRLFRRSLFVVKDMKAGEKFTAENLRSIRPGHGLHPRHYDQVIGRRAARDIWRGTPLEWDLVSGSS